MTVPPRLYAAFDLVDPRPDEHVLEIGCGRGVLGSLLCERLVAGHYTGVDRSATATDATTARLAEPIAAGRATVITSALADLTPPTVDRVVAVNVNVFWTGPAVRELEIVRAALRPGGQLQLIYGSDGGAAPRVDVTVALRGHLRAAGFEPALTTPSRRGVQVLRVVAQAGAQAGR